MKQILPVIILFSVVISAGKSQTKNHFEHAAVVTAHPDASAAGLRILKKGGNAVDAAIAVQFALAVVYPSAGNIGGGGFMIYRSSRGKTYALDYREKAPLRATKDMYLDEAGKPLPEKSLFGGLASGVPGAVAGMEKAHRKFGKRPWTEVLKPAVELAENGFILTAQQAAGLNRHRDQFLRYNRRPVAFVKTEEWKAGDRLIQPELAETLRQIRDQGARAFYRGKTAGAIVQTMKQSGGLISEKDLKQYQAVWRKPVTGRYRDYNVISMPPPSSGGIALLTLLQQAASFPLEKWGFQSDSTVQVMVESERRTFADRAGYLGDPDYYRVPQKALLDTAYIQGRIRGMDFSQATPSSEVGQGILPGTEHEQTTHFSIVDAEGNAVAVTTTLNGSYGSFVVAEGAGFLLNNEMDDFSVKPGSPNMYGLVGGEANAIAPGKRMLSSMTPTIVEQGGQLKLVLGTPGGSTIITSVFQTMLNVLTFKTGMQAAVSLPRFHHQWLPDEIQAEEGAIREEVRTILKAKGYYLVPRTSIGRVDAILVRTDGTLETGADPRGDDTAAGY